MYSRNWSLKEPSAKKAKLATKSPLSRSNSSSCNQEMEGKDHSFSIPVFHPWRSLDGSTKRLSCQPAPSAVFSLAYPLPLPALVPGHYSHSTYSHRIGQYFCWNECSWNTSPPGAGWKTRNEQGDLGAAESFPQSTRRSALPGLSVGCSGTISIVLSYICHLFATGWFSGWAKASVPLFGAADPVAQAQSPFQPAPPTAITCSSYQGATAVANEVDVLQAHREIWHPALG